MSQTAIVSVWDKTGLEPFVRALVARGVSILSTGGTAKFLGELGIPYEAVSDYTGQQEILDGRVKTLHPKIHGGILARKDRDDDLAELGRSGIAPIDFVVVNLYPFTFKVQEIESRGKADHESLVEMIDIGGPTMIRAAAKNCHHVVPICDPADYPLVLDELERTGSVSLETRQQLAAKVFMTMATYDGAVARYFALKEKLLSEDGKPEVLAPIESAVLVRRESLRYGENPHQHASLYQRYQVPKPGEPKDAQTFWKQLQGKELSYNNLLDMQAAIDLFLDVSMLRLKKHAAVIIKHSNPCGVAVSDSADEAFRRARECDPVSAFGGIVAVSGILDGQLAGSILEGFVEVVVAEDVNAEAMELFSKKKNVRVIKCDFARLVSGSSSRGLNWRNFYSEFLVQTADASLADLAQAKIANGPQPSAAMLADMKLAWAICKHVKSNAIVIVRELRAIGVGAGQMSRVDSARLAVKRATEHGHDVKGGVSASDAFLPFPDTLEILNDAGVIALVQPGGSIKDEEVATAAKARGMTMVLTGERHFRH